jgi:preprotein translocase subunit SecE
MTLNREQRRLLQRQGEIDETGEPVRTRRTPPAPSAKEDRTSPGEFVKEVRSELKKVAWPTRQETIRYTIIVFVTLVLLTAFVAGLDWVASQAVLKLFKA